MLEVFPRLYWDPDIVKGVGSLLGSMLSNHPPQGTYVGSLGFSNDFQE